MKKIIIMSLFLVMSGCSTLNEKEGVPKPIYVKEIVLKLQNMIEDFNSLSSGSGLPKLKEAEIKLSTISEKNYSTEGSIIVSGAYGRKSTESNILTLVLTPKKKKRKSDFIEDVPTKIIELTNMLKNNNSNLELKSLSYEVGLGIEDSSTGGFEINFIGVNIKSEAQKTYTTENSMTLVFENEEEYSKPHKQKEPDNKKL